MHTCEPTIEAREAAVAALQRDRGAVVIPPYNYGPVMCGQGTIALELLTQVSGGPNPFSPRARPACSDASMRSTQKMTPQCEPCLNHKFELQAAEQDFGQLDAIVVPVSGGGMISGIAVAAKGLHPSIRIIGAEPTGEAACRYDFRHMSGRACSASVGRVHAPFGGNVRQDAQHKW